MAQKTQISSRNIRDTNNQWVDGIYGVRGSKFVVHMFDDNERQSRSPSVDSRNGQEVLQSTLPKKKIPANEV